MLRLHWSPDSANLVVRIALHRLGLPFEAVRVDRSSGHLRSPDYLALNPQGLLPVLEDGKLVLFETAAILLHLADRTDRLGADGPPAKDAEARARFLRWLFYVSNTVHADLRVAFYAYRYVPEAHIPGLVGGVRARFARHLDMLEAEIARDGSLTGAGPTLADEYLAVCIRWAQNYPHASGAVLKDMSRWPVLLALLQGLEAADPVQTACRAEFIRDARPYTAPTLPDVPRSEITG